MTEHTFTKLAAIGLLSASVTFAGNTLADDEPDAASSDSKNNVRLPKSLDEIAVESMNPVGDLFAVTHDFIYQPFQGDMPNADDQTQTALKLSSSFPFRLSNGKKLVLRGSVPINLTQPTYTFNNGIRQEYIDWRIRQEADTIPRDGSFFEVHGHMYDINYGVAYGGVSDNGFISSIGLAGVLPTSQDGSGERDQYLIGPEATLGKISDWGIIGGTLNHVTNVANARSGINYDTNLTTLKFFYGYSLGNGWQVISNPVITYDWEAADGNKLLFPVGAGVAKTVRFGKMPVKFSLEAQYFVQSPDAFGPDWNVVFSVIPVFKDRSLN